MGASVRISDDTKELLDRLQARITLDTGAKPTFGELLEKLVLLGFRERERLERALGAAWRPLSRAEAEAWMEKFGEDWGVETGEEEIDSILYKEFP